MRQTNDCSPVRVMQHKGLPSPRAAGPDSWSSAAYISRIWEFSAITAFPMNYRQFRQNFYLPKLLEILGFSTVCRNCRNNCQNHRGWRRYVRGWQHCIFIWWPADCSRALMIIWAICRPSNKNTVPPPSKIPSCSGIAENSQILDNNTPLPAGLVQPCPPRALFHKPSRHFHTVTQLFQLCLLYQYQDWFFM